MSSFQAIPKSAKATYTISKGVDATTGKEKYARVTLAGLAPDPDADKVAAVATAAAPCLNGTFAGMEITEVKTIEAL